MAMIFERSPDTDAVIHVLRGCNDQISYRDIARQAGLTLGRAKQVLASARRVLRAEKILFGAIKGEGLRRLVDKDLLKKPQAFFDSTRRRAGREIKEQTMYSNFEGMEKSDQNIVSINRTTLNAIRLQAQVKPAEKKAGMSPQPMPSVARLIEAKGKSSR